MTNLSIVNGAQVNGSSAEAFVPVEFSGVAVDIEQEVQESFSGVAVDIEQEVQESFSGVAVDILQQVQESFSGDVVTLVQAVGIEGSGLYVDIEQEVKLAASFGGAGTFAVNFVQSVTEAHAGNAVDIFQMVTDD